MANFDRPERPTREANSAPRGSADLKVKAAWLYYVEGLTQEQVARHLNVSRLKVLRMLAACNDEGVVRISIAGETASQVALERSLEAEFDLEEAIVVPSPTDPSATPKMIGHAAAEYISNAIYDGVTVGVGWGATLHQSLGSLARRMTNDVAVVSLLGGLVRSQWINPSLFAWRMAEAFGAESFALTAPVYLSDPALRQHLWQEPQLRALLDRAKKMDLAFVGVGGISDNSTVFQHGILPQSDIASLRRAGAVADVLCQFVDAEGRLVDHPVNRQVMAIDLDVLKATPKVIIVAGGQEKLAAIQAALRATGAKVLITDASTAVGLLEQTKRVATA
jgi:DNA-binding transcriptional regulator LsrR (DeoR family)